MAKLSADKTYVTVERGDSLWAIADEFLGDGRKYKQLASINSIKGPKYYIYVGNKIKLTGTSSSSSSTSSSGDPDKAKITAFGLLASSDKETLFAVWTWGKADKTEHYEIEWEYTIADTGSTWWTGSKTTTKDLESSYDIPDNAERIRFRVKPISKTYKKNNKDTTYWTAKWTDFSYYNTSSIPPAAPPAPTVTIDKNNPYKLTAEISDIDAEELNATHIEFDIIRNNTSPYLRSNYMKIDTNYSYVSYTNSKPLLEGSEYKVRCRSVRGSLVSAWSPYSSVVSTPPSKLWGFTVCKAKSSSTDGKVSVYLAWNAVNAATSYDIEYATSREYFDGSDQTTTITGIALTQYETYSLDTGYEYHFRIRAVNDAGKSEWSGISSVTLGEPPAAPTTWASTSVATVGGPLSLYWVHNAKDGSSQTYAQIALEIYIANGIDADGNTNYELKWNTEEEIKNSTDVDDKDKTSSFDVAAYLAKAIPAYYKEGVQLRWRVRTSGVTNELGEWSVVRMVDIHAQPSVALDVRDATNTINTTFETLGSFPIYISAKTQPSTQAPIGFHLTITSNEVYDTVDALGNNKTVNAGEKVYSKYFDQNTDLDDLVLSAGDVDLESGIRYTLTCVASMNSGLTAETSLTFTVNWEEVSYVPNASVMYDPELFVTHIHPYCNHRETTFYKAVYDAASGSYVASSTAVSPVDKVLVQNMYAANDKRVYSEYTESGTLIYCYLTSAGARVHIEESAIVRRENVLTTTGEQVYSGVTETTIDASGNVTGGEDIFFYESVVETPVEGVHLAVYRREFDGSFTELARDIDNLKNTYITDPHPPLDYARYRIVATTDATGAVSYYDLPGYPIQEKAVIIQWDEDWSNFDIVGDDPKSQPPWSGSLLRLPYNIDVSDSYNMDVSHVEYIGRKRPVTYYGTQLGETSTWNVEIPWNDEETLYALRRLAIWPGDVYVREPSGTGYWASVTPSFSQKHCELTIPVTLTITRVEGGA